MSIDAPYSALRGELLAAVDEVLAEPLRASFLKDAAPDPDRPAFEFSAPLRTGKAESEDVSGGRTSAWLTNVAGSVATIWIDRATYEGPNLRKGDMVKALSRPQTPWFQVLYVDDRNAWRLVVYLGAA